MSGMKIIDERGLFHGDRLRRCSNIAQLHWPRLFMMADGFGRIEINYAIIIGHAYPTFSPIPSEADIESIIREYIENCLLFPYWNGAQLWGQWDTRAEFLPRYKTALDRRNPAPPELAFIEWKNSYRQQNNGFPKSFTPACVPLPLPLPLPLPKNICASPGEVRRNKQTSSQQAVKADSGHASPKSEASPRGDAVSETLPPDLEDVGQWLAAFMDGEQPPLNLIDWITEFATEYSLSAGDIHGALDAAWNRNARPGRKNQPRDWNWFYEVLRNALIPGYAARLPEA